MTKLIDQISFLYNQVTSRFECFIVKNEKDLAQCLEIRKQIFDGELNRVNKKNNISIGNKDHIDGLSQHLACYDNKTKQIVGTLRITNATHLVNDLTYRQTYGLNFFPADLLSKIIIVSRLSILKEFRKGPAGFNLTKFAYEYSLDNGIAICTITTEPNIYPLYRKLGYKPLSKPLPSPYGGYRIPLYLILHDYDFLKKRKSPFYNLAKKVKFPQNDVGMKWEKNFLESSKKDDVGFEMIKYSKQYHFEAILFDDISEKTKQILFENAIKVKCNKGDIVIAKNIGSKNFGVVYKGALKVNILEGYTLILGVGDVFGEVSFLLENSRSSDIIASQDNTEVILFSKSILNKIQSEKEKSKFWKNMAKILALRLAYSN